MWKLKVRLKHDCIIGNRCEKFGVKDTGISFNIHREKGKTYSPQIHTIYGEDKKIKKFLRDLEKDKRVTHFESEGNSFFCVEVRKDKVPSTFKTEKLIFVTPTIVDDEGYETWEVASWKRKNLMDFFHNLEKNVDVNNINFMGINKIKLTDVYYPHLMPNLTKNQKRALDLAFENGFYDYPRKSNMKHLAKIAEVSVPTFFEHLKKAEKKIIPDLIRSL